MKILAGRLLGSHDKIANNRTSDGGWPALIHVSNSLGELEHIVLETVIRKESEQGETELRILNDVEHVLYCCADIFRPAIDMLTVGDSEARFSSLESWLPDWQEASFDA